MFRRPSVRYGKNPEPVTPYQKAAQAWDERIGSARVQARNWRLMAFGCLFLAVGPRRRVGLADDARLGRALRGRGGSSSARRRRWRRPPRTIRPTDPQIAWHLARFIENVRQLPADPIVLRQSWLRAYDFVTDQGRSRSTTMPASTTRSPMSARPRSRSRSRASSAPPPTVSGSPGSSGATRAASSPPPSAGPRS